jgi:hypothetical protein
VKACVKQSNRLAEISNYIGKRREMEDTKSVPLGSIFLQNVGTHVTNEIGDNP